MPFGCLVLFVPLVLLLTQNLMSSGGPDEPLARLGSEKRLLEGLVQFYFASYPKG